MPSLPYFHHRAWKILHSFLIFKVDHFYSVVTLKKSVAMKTLKHRGVSLCMGIATAFSASAAWSAAITPYGHTLGNQWHSNAFIEASLSDSKQLQSAAKAASAKAPSVFQLFSHGKPGQLFINGQWLGPQAIAVWLRQNGVPAGTVHLNIYGCEFAQGEVGAQAVKTLEQLLGLSVAASTNVTGQGGDWVLEMGQPVAALRVEDYAHSLQCTNNVNCDGDAFNNVSDLDDDNDGILDTLEGALATATTLNFERIYTTGGANYAAGNYDVGAPGQYSWSYTGTIPTDVVNAFVTPTQSSDDGIRIVNTSFTINFANPVSNLEFSFSDIDGGTIGVHSSYERMVVNAYDINGTLLDADLYIAFIGSRVVNNTSLANTFDGLNPSSDLTQTDPVGTLRFNFGSVLIDRIQITTQAAGATLRFQEPKFTAYTGRDTDGDGLLDHFDNDSDNDNCADAIEGGGSFTASNIDANGRLTGTVQATPAGVPTAAGGGQSLGDSIVATQVVVNGANPITQTVTTIPSAASFTISTTATNTSSFTAGTPNYASGSSANANTVYQWYLGDPDAGGTAVTNTGVYTGSTTATLGISNVNNLIGNTYYVVATQSNHTCTRIKRSAQLLSSVVDLAVTKTNNLPGTADQANDTVARGQPTAYQIIVTNNGPGAVTGATVSDTAAAGLTCTTLTCSSAAGSCPGSLPTAAAFTSGTAIALGALPVGGTVTLDVGCTVN
jgi:uncharacterized repeat protein (TIGR01451 family)